MPSPSDVEKEILIQVRVPVVVADKIRARAQQTGMATSHWVRDVVVRALEAPELPAWSIDEEDVGKDSPVLRNWEFGRTNPHYLLIVRDFAGDRLCAEIRGGPAQGRPATEPLSLDSFRAIYRDSIRGRHLYIRGGGFWWVERVFDVANRPLVAFLKFEADPPFDAQGRSTRAIRSGRS
jgi:hypothetical protein